MDTKKNEERNEMWKKIHLPNNIDFQRKKKYRLLLFAQQKINEPLRSSCVHTECIKSVWSNDGVVGDNDNNNVNDDVVGGGGGNHDDDDDDNDGGCGGCVFSLYAEYALLNVFVGALSSNHIAVSYLGVRWNLLLSVSQM